MYTTGKYLPAVTAGLTDVLRVGGPVTSPETHWWVFLAKTTAYF